MKYKITFCLLLLAGLLPAQSPDLERMNRDIEVAENILASLMQEAWEKDATATAARLAFIGENNVEGSYLEGFGVLFTLSPKNFPAVFGVRGGRSNMTWSSDPELVIVEEYNLQKEKNQRREAATSDSTSSEQFFRNVATTFLADYAYLLRQLPEKEQVMIRYGGNAATSLRWDAGVLAYGRSSQSAFSAAVKKSDLDALQTGKINRNQLIGRIEFTAKKDEPGEEDRNLVLLSSIFSRLYKTDLSETFWINGSPTYERIKDLGAIIYLSVGSRYARTIHSRASTIRIRELNRNGLVITDVPDAEEVDEEEAAKKLDDAFPEFREELKGNIVEYGSIVKDLSPNEALIFRVSLTDCPACEAIPKSMEITARQTTLEDYRKGKLSLDEAARQLKVVENR